MADPTVHVMRIHFLVPEPPAARGNALWRFEHSKLLSEIWNKGIWTWRFLWDALIEA